MRTILGVVVAAALLVWLTYRVFFTGEGQAYFSADPWKLLWVGLVALAGGVLSVVYRRMLAATRRRHLIVVRVLLAMGYVALFVVFLCQSAGWGLMAVSLACFGYTLFQLYRVWNRVD
jgi:predicted small integral membrane protein